MLSDEYLLCTDFTLHSWMTIISKSTQGAEQKTAVGNNSYLLFFSCPQPGPTRRYEKKSDF